MGLAPLGGQKLRVGLGETERGESLAIDDHLEVGIEGERGFGDPASGLGNKVDVGPLH